MSTSDPNRERPQLPAETASFDGLGHESIDRPQSEVALSAQPDRPLSAQRFGDYELESEIARGGMGIVYFLILRREAAALNGDSQG